MVEGGVIHKAGKTKLFDCFHLSRSNPYIFAACIIRWNWRATLWLCHRVISRALLYIRDEFQKVDRSTPLQEIIVSMVVAGAIVGSAIGGWMNDSWGRRISILIVDVLFAIGAIVMGIASSPGFIILERVFVGLGVGMASMTVPLYISEASSAKIRGALVSLNGLLITGEQFITYLVNLAFAHKRRTWRWMLRVAGVPAVIQFILMMFLPESPRWLYRKHVFLTSFLFFQDRKEEAATILKKLYPPHEVEAEVEALRLSFEAEIVKEGSIGAGNIFTKIKNAWSNTVVHRGLATGKGCQVAQQFVGINTVMYYSPTMVQFAGYASNSVALSLSLITSGLNAFGSIVSMLFVDRYGRRKLLLVSMVGIIICLFMLTGVFEYAKKNMLELLVELTLLLLLIVLALITPMHPMQQTGTASCLAVADDCGFCANSDDHLKPGACLAFGSKKTCQTGAREWYTKRCPSNVGLLAVLLLGFIFSPTRSAWEQSHGLLTRRSIL
ncbi:hypothetical protein GIB67_033445 [Kingdonia uniflora]|uniref:Major facilitator superfamily (MFS) profile domain-containing protein n=1 Tax=Kingdonia uniflora TaxID=39325 RepID=A0A7J7LTT8_9MAGN|nr:hypothetical protein GIB67_033445 [Kingdonia uniflora]